MIIMEANSSKGTPYPTSTHLTSVTTLVTGLPLIIDGKILTEASKHIVFTTTSSYLRPLTSDAGKPYVGQSRNQFQFTIS